MRYQFLRFPDGREKAVTMSYDDGCPQDIRLAQTVSKYGMKCTFNLNSDELRNQRLTKEMIEENFLSKGHEIAVHGALHKAEGTLRPIVGIRDVLDCRLELEERYGIIIRGMAYPDSGIRHFANNSSYEKVKNYLTELDIVYARTLGGDNDGFALPNDWHSWMPTCHHNNPNIHEYIDKFLKIDMSSPMHPATRTPKLFYIWGHSYEFDGLDNWSLLYDICSTLGQHSDIWYATNIEIYNYVNAYNSLIYSANSKIIYNPTLYKIWFDIDGKLYVIESGETLRI